MRNGIDFWNKMSSNYDSQVSKIYKDAYNETIRITKKFLKKSDVVLDYACGTGITTIELSENVDRIHAIDYSKEMVKIAENKTSERNISNINFDVIDIFDEKLEKESFDVVLAFNILYFIKDTDKVINRINEILKNNGLFISVTDCLGEKKTLMIVIQSLLSKLRLIPYMRKIKVTELEEIISSNNFSIIETHCLHDSPPNYYVVARKL